MRILLSAFACDPEEGSEPGVGWAWAYQLAKTGHEVTVLTRDYHRTAIQGKLSLLDLSNLHFEYVGVRHLPFWIPILGVYPYYCAWQLKVYLLADKHAAVRGFDCVHHLTYGSYRTPFFLSLLAIPSIFGPVGGGEMTPVRLLKGMSLAGKVRECARIVANAVIALNPITRIVWRRSSLILAATEDTLRMVPGKYRFKCRVLPAVTTPPLTNEGQVFNYQRDGKLRVLFVGRLLEWKGLHLAIRALSIAQHTVPGLTLSIRGDGPHEAELRALVRREGLEEKIMWIPRFTVRDEVLSVYDKHDLLIFPSMHDSGGTVVLEALSRRLPVICLKLGGPGVLIDSSCGACIDTERRSGEEIIQSIAMELIRFGTIAEPEWNDIRNAAHDRAMQFIPSEIVGKAYSWFTEMKTTPIL